VRAQTINRISFTALAALVAAYTLLIGDTVSAAASPAWLGVALILIGTNVVRLRSGIRPSTTGMVVGIACGLLAGARITGVVSEVTPTLALATVVIPVLFARIVLRARR